VKVPFSVLVGVAVVTGLAATAASSFAAFSSLVGNSGNSIAFGTVSLSDNDASGATLSLSSAKPGDSDTGCIKITYTGSLAANVRLYASTSGALAPYVNLVVTRGTDSSPSFRSCTNFTADATNYIGSGAGVIYSGALTSFPTSFASGLVDPSSGSPATWNANDTHSYKLTLTLQDDNNDQGLSGSATISWEARNT
jgi:hypothetical protein